MSDEEASMKSASVGRVAGAPLFQHKFLDGRLDQVRYPDGSVGEQVLIHHPGASAVVPFLSDPRGADPQLLLIHQYRYATGGNLFEIPAGRLEAGEAPLTCAHRELLEETGCTATSMELLTAFWTTPGFTNEKIHVFLASGITRGATAHEADEFIEVVTVPLSEALRRIETGEITDAKTMIGILFAAGFRAGR
jgi:ADP-ribose pyrophosphatase